MPTFYESTTPFVVAGRAKTSEAARPLTSPADGRLLTSVWQASIPDVDEAVSAAEIARGQVAAMPRHRRAAVLAAIASLIEVAADHLSEMLVLEVGKCLKDARAEVHRAVATLQAAARATLELTGETIPLDSMVGGEGRLGFTLLEPVGVVAGITGFNFPLLLAVHKLGPAIGAGCPIVLKPSDLTPLTTLELGLMAVSAGWPAGAISVLTGGHEVGEALVGHPLVSMVSFTGSASVGARIAEQAGRGLKRLSLELGSTAATIVAADAPLELAADRCTAGAFAATGQSCISVQRVYVHESVLPHFAGLMRERVEHLVAGDPLDPATDVGLQVSDAARERVTSWVREALEEGAQLLSGGIDENGRLRPTVLVNATASMKVVCQEVFGPVVSLIAFKTLDEAISLVNDSEYGLQAGIFTRDLDVAACLARRLRVGGVNVNETSNWRADHMPYGGVKASGYGKEGPAYAMRAMSVEKMVTIRTRGVE